MNPHGDNHQVGAPAVKFAHALGAEDDGRGAYFNGELADAFVEKKILTADEILKAINRKRP